MKTNIVISVFILFVLSVGNSFAQSEAFRFAKTGSKSSIHHVEVDSIGNNYLAGTFQTSFTYQGITIQGNDSPKDNLFLLKTTPSGEPIYLKSIYGIDNGDSVAIENISINQKGELSIILLSSAYESIMIGELTQTLNPAINSKIVIKFSKSGFLNPNWVKILETDKGDSQIYPKDIALDESGNLFVTGDFIGNSAIFDGQTVAGIDSSSKVFLVKYASTGNVSWASGCDHMDSGSGEIYASDVEVCKDGTVYISGSHTGNRSYLFNTNTLQCKGISNAYIACYNSSGDAQWAIPFEGDNYVIPEMIATDDSANLAFVCFYKSSALVVDGTTYTSTNDYDILVSYINSIGEFRWKKSHHTNLPFLNYGSKNAYSGFNKAGDLFLAGEFFNTSTNIYFFKYNVELGALYRSLLSTGSGTITLENVTIDNFGNITTSGNTFSSFEIGGETIENSGAYGTSYFFKVSEEMELDFLFQQENRIDETVDFDFAGADKYNNVFVLGNYSGANANLNGISLGDDYTDGIFTSEYGNIGSIKGKVIDFYNEPVSGHVRLIIYTNYQLSPLADSVSILADGSFEFAEVPQGKYLLEVVPENSEGTNYLSSYFPSIGSWEDAAHIEVDESNLSISNIYILVPEEETFTGQARLSGIVNTIDEDDFLKGSMQSPKAEGKVNLAKRNTMSNLQLIASTETNENGDFAFENVDDGDYVVFIDIAGLPTEDPHRVIISNGRYVSDINYYIDEEKITAEGSPSGIIERDIDKQNSIFVYPNPSNGELHISSTNNTSIQSLIIVDIHGKIIEEFYSIDSEVILYNYSPGIYFAKIIINNTQETIKFIITP